MNIAILSRNPGLYSTQSLARAARLRHHYARIIDYVNCDLIIEDGKLTISYQGQVLKDIDAIIPRIGASWTNFGAAVIRQFEHLNVFTSLSSDALIKARNKLSCSQILAANGLQLPKTIVSNNSYLYKNLLKEIPGDQVVVKLINGTHGIGVVLADNKVQAESILDAFNRAKQKSMMQEFIKESKGTDIRIFIVDGEIVGSMKRKAKEGEFRSNLHRGGTSSKIEITDNEKEVALKAAKSLGLTVAGVDMLRSQRGPLVLEVNASPGLEGIETTTKVDIAGRIINFVERNAK
ncbi:MAG: RimK family alpha-L-glutamate ligase [Saprospiraceae bacterium]|nr:RimK family alpha-L-glutamate ligase [Bacteroidia bacterium]NNL93946.1 RimK family alpha-L-glutamate ligase [Saprospiraceae bacterium]